MVLREWHQAQHLGLPGSFFQLVECVEADVYLFCDQDDIWEPGKIDATVAHLLGYFGTPTLCFSDSILFYEGAPTACRRWSEVIGKKKVSKALRKPPMFEMFSRAIAPGHTQGFTRPLREIYLTHREIARKHAFMHDWWMHDIAIASGVVHFLSDVPTVFWRQNPDGFCEGLRARTRKWIRDWRTMQLFRRVMSRHARGFILAAPTLPPGKHLERLLGIAKLIEALDLQQTPAALFRLARCGALPQTSYSTFYFLISCLLSNAVPVEPTSHNESRAAK